VLSTSSVLVREVPLSHNRHNTVEAIKILESQSFEPTGLKEDNSDSKFMHYLAMYFCADHPSDMLLSGGFLTATVRCVHKFVKPGEG